MVQKRAVTSLQHRYRPKACHIGYLQSVSDVLYCYGKMNVAQSDRESLQSPAHDDVVSLVKGVSLNQNPSLNRAHGGVDLELI